MSAGGANGSGGQAAAAVTMFISTGRCGTQWLTTALAELHPELRVEHEPIGPLYSPRRFFRRWEDPEAVLEVPAVREHLEGVLAGRRAYVETGWPLFSALPLLAERIPERLRVVHLVRHPVPTALSHLAHSSYADSSRDDAFTRLATLGPEDPQVFHPEYAAWWGEISPYEKCLFWWTEVNSFGLEFPQRAPEIPFLRIRAEDLLGGEERTLVDLLRFLGLPRHQDWTARLGRRVDRWHHHTDQDLEPELIARHPATVTLARQIGYDPLAVDVDALRARYAGTPDDGSDRLGRYETPART